MLRSALWLDLSCSINEPIIIRIIDYCPKIDFSHKLGFKMDKKNLNDQLHSNSLVTLKKNSNYFAKITSQQKRVSINFDIDRIDDFARD